MRARPLPMLLALACLAGTVQASSRTTTLRVTLTVVERCDVRGGEGAPSVECSAGVPWTVAAASPAPHAAAAGGPRAAHLPVPAGDPEHGARVTTIVF